MERVLLYKSRTLTVVLLRLQQGCKIHPHGDFDSYLKVLTGNIYHRSFGQTKMMAAGDSTVVTAGSHSILARQDSTIIARYVETK